MRTINVQVTVQEGGVWLPARFQGLTVDLKAVLEDRGNWLVGNLQHGATAAWTIVPLSISGGMYTMAAVHSVQLFGGDIWDSYHREFFNENKD